MIRVVPIRLRWSNAYLLIGDSVILVDSGTAGEFDTIDAAIRREGVSPDEIEWILHTHGHPDHCGNTAEFQSRYHTSAAIHELDEPMAKAGGGSRLTATGIAGEVLRRLIRLPAGPFVPDLVLQGDGPLDRFGITGRILATPGHTAGSLSVIVNGNEAIVGDLLMGGWFGGMVQGDVPRLHYFADDLQQVRSSVSRLLDLDVQRLYVGHGGPIRRTDIAAKSRLCGET